MEVAAATDSIESRLSVIASAQSPTFVSDAIARVVDWLKEQNVLPPRSVVIKATERALEKIFAAVDFPGPDEAVEPIIRLVIITGVGYAYDRLANPRVTV